ncbi:MAG TPA: hypothetical protein PKA09_17675, partial [Geminicoccus sp.]|nr:hypothetical protein [Geminicoccus sp.]
GGALREGAGGPVGGGGGAAEDGLCGGAGTDRLYGGSEFDELYGAAGNDLLYGGDAGDVLDGGAGTDRLYGGNGDDWLQSGLGNDLLYGGAGHDVYCGDGYWLDPKGSGHALGIGFARGADHVFIDNSRFVRGPEQFDFLDSNNDNKIDGRDKHVSSSSVTHEGVTKSSLVIDLGTFQKDFDGGGSLKAGQYTLTLYGVRVLEESDFLL